MEQVSSSHVAPKPQFSSILCVGPYHWSWTLVFVQTAGILSVGLLRLQASAEEVGALSYCLCAMMTLNIKVPDLNFSHV